MNKNTIKALRLAGAAARLALDIMISKLPCEECGASDDEKCASTCRAALSDEDTGSYPG